MFVFAFNSKAITSHASDFIRFADISTQTPTVHSFKSLSFRELLLHPDETQTEKGYQHENGFVCAAVLVAKVMVMVTMAVATPTKFQFEPFQVPKTMN